MNNICIIYNNGNHNILNLDFKTDSFILDNNIYHFEIVDKTKILVYWSDSNKELYYTDDSYLYFSNIIMKTNFKKIFLINSQWYDQALYIINTGELKRIKHCDQYGIVINNISNRFIIDWNYWGKEEYIKIDEYNYVVKNYKYNLSIIKSPEFKNNINVNIHIFIHVCILDGWKDILKEQLNVIKESGLYDVTKNIHFGIVGNCNIINEYEFNNDFNSIFNDVKYNILYIDSRIELYELNTINYIKYMCSNGLINEEAYILYIHTKGVRNAGNPDVTTSWRNMMQYFLINQYKECIKNLDYYDALGNNCVNMGDVYVNKDKKHCYHYSGNFWWSKKSHIDKLDYLDIYNSIHNNGIHNNSIHNNILNHNIRYLAENWILSKYPDGKYGVLFQDDTNTHPYHRYVFEYYKKFTFIVKDICIIK